MPHDRSAWFRAPDDSDVEDFIDIEECAETPPRRSRLRWALGTAVALVIPAGAFALVPSGRAPPAAAAEATAPEASVRASAVAPVPSNAAARVDAVAAPTPAPVAPASVVETPQPDPSRAVAPSFPARRAAARAQSAPLLPRFKFSAPASGLNDLTVATNRLAARFAAAGKWESARGLYLKSTRAAPDDPEGWFGLALCHFELGSRRAATVAAQRALLANPNHAMSNLFLGFLAQQRGCMAEARGFYASYLAAEPTGAYAGELASVLELLPRD